MTYYESACKLLCKEILKDTSGIITCLAYPNGKESTKYEKLIGWIVYLKKESKNA